MIWPRGATHTWQYESRRRGRTQTDWLFAQWEINVYFFYGLLY